MLVILYDIIYLKFQKILFYHIVKEKYVKLNFLLCVIM